ncbi:lipoprotein-releasing system ATP-binding protein LolD, partial [Candidatus Roizmanbacteria bacterium CG_4_10_14_0_8_um_filter_35_28]
MPEPIIKLENVWKIYQLGKIEVPALKGVSLDINPGSFVSIMGTSG